MNFQFADPWLLILALILPILLTAMHLWSRRSQKPAAMQHAAAGMVRALPRSARLFLRPALFIMRVIAVVMLVLALARPQIVQGRETITGEGVDIALAVDISGSMASLDFQPQNRLEAAKQVIASFIAERPYDRIGLVIFSSEAFNQSPMTLDHKMVDRSLQEVQLATDLGLDDGTAIGLGLANAANMLAQGDAESRVVILLTDGVNNSGQIDPLTAAEAAAALDIRVYTIGAAKTGQVPVPVPGLFGGTQITYQESVLDEATLQQVADITGGQYYRAEDTSGLQAIYDEINQLEKSQVEIQVFNNYTELAAWFLLPALLILLIELILRNTYFRRLP